MAELYRFFDSSTGDIREYTAGEWSEYFNLFYKDGVHAVDGRVDLKVSSGSGLRVNIATGYGFINGRLYNNDAVLSKTISTPDSNLARIDRVVLRFDEIGKFIKVFVIKGVPASSPIAPTLKDTSTLKEISLAQVRVRAGATNISEADVIDERMTEFCGIISPVYNLPIEDLWDDWNIKKQEVTTDFNTWWDLVKGQLGARVITSSNDPINSQMNNGDVWIKWE